MKISLCIIVKPTDEEAKKLDTCLASCAEHFDELVITQAGSAPNDAVSNVIDKYNGTESFYTWDDDFAAARNYNFSCATGDWIFWLDADDTLAGAENLKKAIELAEQNNVSGLSTLYHYKVVDGKVVDKHWKTQAIKNDGHAHWKGIIHEDLLPKRPVEWASIKDVVRIHTATEDDNEASLKRNLKILKKAIEKEPDEPRHYFYTARCCLGIEDWDGTIDAVQKYLDLSDWKTERYDAWNMAGEAYMCLGNLDAALRAHNDALLEMEYAPDAYIYKARIYVKQEEWRNALTCLQIAELQDKDAPILKRDALYDHDLYLLAAVANLNLGRYKEGVDCAERANKNRRSEKSQDILKLAQDMYNKEQTTLEVVKKAKKVLGKPKEVLKILDEAPQDIQDDPRLLRLRFGAQEPKTWSDNSVVVFCGNSLEDWDGNSTGTGGIGGSETAVIEIAERLVKSGKDVTVYNRCGAYHEGKVINGVKYMNFWQFNKEDTFNVLWLWRAPNLLLHGIKAKNVLVDMHDVSSPDVFYPEVNDQINHVLVKTNYHKSLYPTVPADKFNVIGNGIKNSRYAKKVTKNKNKFIYTSTPNRGLEQLCEMWPEIRKRIPDAELHTFYGWTTFYESHKNNPAQLAWMRKMQGLMSQDGIINHGRVDQDTLAQHQLEAYLWLYPTAFPEIHCITALEMQAAGAYPITTGYAALEETQKVGIKLPGDTKSKEWQEKYINEVVFAYENPDTIAKEVEEGKKWAKENDWDNVTEQWLTIL